MWVHFKQIFQKVYVNIFKKNTECTEVLVKYEENRTINGQQLFYLAKIAL